MEGPGEGRGSARGAVVPGLLTDVCVGLTPSKKKREEGKKGRNECGLRVSGPLSTLLLKRAMRESLSF